VDVDRSWEYINRSQTNVEIGTEAAQVLEKEYINGIFVAVKQFKSSKVIVNLDIKKFYIWRKWCSI
jgi:hypothetical protein